MATSWHISPVTETNRVSTVQSRTSDANRLKLLAARERAAEIAIASILNPTLSPEAIIAGNAIGLVGEDPMFQQIAAREQEQTGFLGGMANAFDEVVWDFTKGVTRWVGLAFEGSMDEMFSRPIRTATNMTSHGMGLEEAYAESGGSFMGGFGESLERTWDALGEGKYQEALGLKGNVANMSEGIFASSTLAPEMQYQFANLDASAETVGTDRDLTAEWGLQNYGVNFAKLSVEQRKMMYLSQERDRIYQEASTEGTELYDKQSAYGSPYVDAHRREAESVLSYTPELATRHGGSGVGQFSQVSPGRSIMMTVTEPGTKPYHYMSGAIDFFVQIFGDPADVGLAALSRSVKASRALGVSNEAIRTAQDNARIMDTVRDTIKGYEANELVELSSKAEETQKYAAILAEEADVVGKGSIVEGRKELQRLGRARTEANRLTAELREMELQPDLTTVVKREMGLLDGTPRKDVDGFKVSNWITGKTAVPFVDNFVRAKTIDEIDALLSGVKTPIPRKLRSALAEADNNAEVVGLLLPHVGNVITESGIAAVPTITRGRLSSPTGLLARGMGLINPTVSARETAFYANQGMRVNSKMMNGGSALARRFSLVAPSTLDLNDLDKAYGDLRLLSDNLGTKGGEVLTFKTKNGEMTASLNDIMEEFINVRDGDFVGAYDVLTKYMSYSFEHLSAEGLSDEVAAALVRFTGNLKDDALWFTNRVGDIVREPNAATRTSVGATEVINPGPQLITELFNGTVMMPDHNLIRRAVNETDRFGRIMNNLALVGSPIGTKGSRATVDDFNQRMALRVADSILSTVWKPLVLLRFAWPFRVIGEEQIRLSAAGLGGMFSVAPGSGHHPLSYIAMALGDAGKKDGDIALRHLDVLGDDITKAEEFIAAQSRRVNFDGQIGAKGDRYWTTTEKYDSSGNISGAYLDGLATELNQLWSDPVVQRLFMQDDSAFDLARTRALSAPSAPTGPPPPTLIPKTPKAPEPFVPREYEARAVDPFLETDYESARSVAEQSYEVLQEAGEFSRTQNLPTGELPKRTKTDFGYQIETPRGVVDIERTAKGWTTQGGGLLDDELAKIAPTGEFRTLKEAEQAIRDAYAKTVDTKRLGIGAQREAEAAAKKARDTDVWEVGKQEEAFETIEATRKAAYDAGINPYADTPPDELLKGTIEDLAVVVDPGTESAIIEVPIDIVARWRDPNISQTKILDQDQNVLDRIWSGGAGGSGGVDAGRVGVKDAGFTEPIDVITGGRAGDNIIIENGHHRLMAAEQNDLTTIPVSAYNPEAPGGWATIIDSLTDADKARLRVIEVNRGGVASVVPGYNLERGSFAARGEIPKVTQGIPSQGYLEAGPVGHGMVASYADGKTITQSVTPSSKKPVNTLRGADGEVLGTFKTRKEATEEMHRINRAEFETAEAAAPLKLDKSQGFTRVDEGGEAIIEGYDTLEDYTRIRDASLKQVDTIDRAGRASYTSSKEYQLPDGTWVVIKTAEVDGMPFAIVRNSEGTVVGSFYDGMAGTARHLEDQGLFTEVIRELSANQGMTKADFANEMLSSRAASAGRKAYGVAPVPRTPTKMAQATEAPRKLGPRSGTYDDRPAVMPTADLYILREYDRASDASSGVRSSRETIDYWRNRFAGKTPDEIFNELGHADLPILSIDRAGNVVLIEGNHRIAAAIEAGLEEFPVRMVTEQGGANLRAGATMNTKTLPVNHLDDIVPGAWGRLQDKYPGFATGDYIPADISPGDVFTPKPPEGALSSADQAKYTQMEFIQDQLDELDIERGLDDAEDMQPFYPDEGVRRGHEENGVDPEFMTVDDQIERHQRKLRSLEEELSASEAVPRTDASVRYHPGWNRPMSKEIYDKQRNYHEDLIRHHSDPEQMAKDEVFTQEMVDKWGPDSDAAIPPLERQQQLLDELDHVWNNGRVLSGPGATPMPVASDVSQASAHNVDELTKAEYDALPDDEWVEVYHITDRETAEGFVQDGIHGKTKDVKVGDEIRAEQGMTGEGLYVGSNPDIIGMYGYDPYGEADFITMKVVARKGDVQMPPEVWNSTGNQTAYDGLVSDRQGAVILGDVPAENITAIRSAKEGDLPARVGAPSDARRVPSTPTEAPAAGVGKTFKNPPKRSDMDRIEETAAWLNTDEGSYWLRELTRTAPDEYRNLLNTEEGLTRYLEGVYARAHLKAGGEYRFLLGDGTYIDDAGTPGRLTAAEIKQYGDKEGYIITRQGDARLLNAYGTGKLDAATGKPLNVRRRFTTSDVKRKDAISEAQTLTDVRKVKEQLRNIVNDEANAGVNFPQAVKTNRYLQDDVNSISSTYDNVVNRMFDWFMSRPTNRLSRSPAFRSSYWQRMGDLMPHMDETLKAEVLAASKAAKMDTIMMGRTGSVRKGVREARGAGVEGGTITSLEDADKLAKAYALTEVQDILYDLSKKHNISEAMSIIFPFIEAYGEVSSTWAKLMTQEWGRPFRRFQQVIEGGKESSMFDQESGYTNNGFFHKDQYGNEVFTASFPIPFIGEVEGQFDYSLEGMNFLSTVVPGFGPAIQIPANLFLPQDAQWDHIRELISPFGGNDGNFISSSLPSWMKRMFMSFEDGRSLLGSDNDQRMFENTVIDVLRAQAIADPEGYKAAMADPKKNADMLARARSDARNLYLIRSAATFMGPTSPSFTPVAEDKDGRIWAYSALASMYYTLKEEANGDDLKATERFDELFGLNPVPLVTGKTREILPRSSTRVGNQFQRNNTELFAQFPGTAFFLGPANLEEAGDFYYPAYYQQLVDGAREDLSEEEWSKVSNDFYGELAYDTAVKRVMKEEGVFDSKDISDGGENALRDYNIKLQYDFPGYQYSFGANITGVPSRVDRSEQITEITKMTQDAEMVSQYEAVQGAKAYLTMRDAALAAMRKLGWANLTSSQDDKAIAIRAWLRVQGDQYAGMYPEFAPMWDGIFMNEIAEKRDTIDYDLVLEQVGGSG